MIITVSVFVFLGACVLGAELWIRHKIRAVIEKEAAALTDSGMSVGVGRISVNIPTRSVTVRDITVKSQNNDPNKRGFTIVSLDAGVAKISLRGIGYKKNDGKPALKASSIAIDAPHATLVTKGETAESGNAGDGKSLQQIFSEKLNSITVGGIAVSDIDLDYVAWNDNGDNTRLGVENGNLEIDGFMIDPLTPAEGRVLFSDDVRLTAGRVSYGYDAGDFILRADTLSAHAAAGNFSLKTIALIPQYPKDEFAQKSKKHQDWTEFALNELKCTGVDYAGLINNNTLSVDSLSFAAGHLASYKNRQVWQEPRVKPMLYQTIQDLPIAVAIKEIVFADLDIEYYELAQEGDTQGVVTFTNGAGTVRNLTNIAEGHDRFCTVDMSAGLMGNGRMHALFHFPVSADDDHWDVRGSLGNTDLKTLNAAIEPLANVKIKSGTVESVDFHIAGTSVHSHVELTMLYNDLSVAFLKRHEDGRERKFLTFIADGMVLHKDNPGHHGKVRTGEAEFERDPHKSMYNYLWKSLFAGVKKTVI